MGPDADAVGTGTGDFVAVSLFSTKQVAPAARFAAARAYTSPFFELKPTGASWRDPEAWSASYLLGEVVLNETRFGPMVLQRPDRRRATTGHEFVTLCLVLQGRLDGLIGEAVFGTRPGELHLFDGAPATRFRATRRHILCAHMPYRAIGFDPSRHPPHMAIALDSATGRIIEATLRTLHSQAASTRRTEAPRLAAGFCALLRSLLGFGPADEAAEQAVDDARGRAMRAYLDRRLHHPALGVDDLCRAFSVSRATCFRLFAKDAGIASYLRRRRVERAFQDLAAGPPRRGSVKAAAERWGFDDPSHFHRSFRQRFQLSPAEVARVGTAAAAGPSLKSAGRYRVTPVYDWLRAG